jgi:hypothetical protein
MRTQSQDTDPRAEEIQIELLRKATVARRLSLAFSLSQTVIRMAQRAIRRQNADLSDQDILLRFVAIHYGQDLAERLDIDLRRRLQ